MAEVLVSFVGGTLELEGAPVGWDWDGLLTWDERTRRYRGAASCYADVLRSLRSRGYTWVDRARAYEELSLRPKAPRVPRPFQAEALEAWQKAKGRGVVVLPTGAGKSHVALMAMVDKQRSTLVVAPTLDLVRQWHGLLTATFQVEVGVLGGGEHELLPLTVSTYDSAYLHVERMGNRFGLVVFDECHHLPSESYSLIAKMSLAPFRLGLSATPERADGRDELLPELIGEVCYRKQITELAGQYLAEYETERVVVELSAEEREEYEAEREIYLGFVRSQGIALGSPRGFSEFVQRAARSAQGQRAHAAYLRQRALAFAASGKQAYLETLLDKHRRDRVIIFTQDNHTAYEVSRRFLLPIITHQTKVRERVDILQGFDTGRYGAIVTSKVLNEGVDVPSANVAVVLSGSGSVMEHVQRLGRILRQSGDKRAKLYEIVSAKTSETRTSDRRREHAAYQRPRYFGKGRA